MGDLSCERFADLLGDYVEGVLPAEQRPAMEAHLGACSRCSDLLADYRRIPEVVRRATDVAMPSGAKARLRHLLSRVWRWRR